jgi:hypothetical protein
MYRIKKTRVNGLFLSALTVVFRCQLSIYYMRLMADIRVTDSEFLVDMQKHFRVFLGPSNVCKITKELVLP